MSKFEIATEIFNANSGINRKDFIAKCVEAGIGSTTAQTYFYKMKDLAKNNVKVSEKVTEDIVVRAVTKVAQAVNVGGRWDNPEFANFTENDIPMFLKK